MADAGQKYCEKCRQILKIDNFYRTNNLEKYSDGRLNTCKKCLTMHVDNWDPDTYYWILEECDVPFIAEEWNKLMIKFAADRSKVTGATIIGRYLGKMALKQFKDYRWKDTEYLREEYERRIRDTMRRQGYDAEEIDNAIKKGIYEMPEKPPDESVAEVAQDDYFAEISGDDDFYGDLTEEDKTYLRLKWGKAYRPEEWVKLEQLYNEMMESYDIREAGHIDTLKLVCKTSLKANQLIDLGDVEGFQKMQKAYDSLMKSGHFTANQNKTEEGEAIDSIGELVAICEKEGFIPKYYVDGPQDKVDRVIQDLQKYTYDLVSNETSLDTLFESAQREMVAEQERIAAAASLGDETSESEEDKLFDYDVSELKDEDYIEMYDFLESERKQDEQVI